MNIKNHLNDVNVRDAPVFTPLAPIPQAQVSPGAMLKAAREAQNLSHADVASRLYLSQNIIVDLENDRHEHIKGDVFVRGYLTNYAQLLNISPKKILAALNTLSTTTTLLPSERTTKKVTKRLLPAIWINPTFIRWAFIGLLGLSFVLVGIKLYHKQRTAPQLYRRANTPSVPTSTRKPPRSPTSIPHSHPPKARAFPIHATASTSASTTMT